MEKFKESLLNAKKKILAADHMCAVTFEIMHNPKILMSVIENAFQAVSYAMDSILFLEIH